MTLGEHIRTAKNIYAHIYGEESVWLKVDVNEWILTARKVTAEMRAVNFEQALQQLREIPVNLLTELIIK